MPRACVFITALLSAVFAILVLHYNTAQMMNHQRAMLIAAEAAETYTNNLCTDSNASADGNCVLAALQTAYANSLASADLKAQQDMAVWSFIVMISTIVGIILLAGTLRETSRAVDEAAAATTFAKDTAEITKQELELTRQQLRPILSLAGVTVHASKDSTGTVNFAICIENHGGTAAFNVRCTPTGSYRGYKIGTGSGGGQVGPTQLYFPHSTLAEPGPFQHNSPTAMRAAGQTIFEYVSLDAYLWRNCTGADIDHPEEFRPTEVKLQVEITYDSVARAENKVLIQANANMSGHAHNNAPQAMAAALSELT